MKTGKSKGRRKNETQEKYYCCKVWRNWDQNKGNILLNGQGRRVSNPTISKTKYALTNGRENTFLPKK